MIRAVQVDDMQSHFDESIAGTAIAHLQRGLFEAHARDEAGWEDEGGHKQMWFAARDIAFEDPVTEDMTQTMLERMGIVARRRQAADAGGGPPQRGGAAPVPRPRSLARDDAAAHGRAAVHRGLGVPHVRVGRGGARPTPISSPATARAADLVRYIRADETPHVDYLRTALTEMRDRTFVGESGAQIPGTEVIGTLWDAALELSLGAEPRELRADRDRRGRARARGATRAAPRSSKASTRSRPSASAARVKFGIFYEHQLPAAVDGRLRVPADPGRARADRVRRPHRHRLRVGGRAPLPRGVLALERARGVPRGRVAAHARASGSGTASCRRRRRSTIPARIAERIAMLDLVSHGRADFGTGESSSEAELGGFMIDPERQARDVGRGPARRGALHDRGAVHRSLGRVRHDAAAQRRAEAAPEAAPAAVGRVQPARHDPPRRAERHRRARVRVRRSRRSEVLGRRLLRDARAARACRSATR